MKKILITQSNYIPWKGYFESIDMVDEFIIYDEMQYTRRDWRNRNIIKTSNVPLWLTIPVKSKGNYFQKINKIQVANNQWASKHWKSIETNYKNTEYWHLLASFIKGLFERANEMTYLSEINFFFISQICDLLGINTSFKRSNDFELADEKTTRLVKICLDTNATDYYTGPAAKKYINVNEFDKFGINVHFHNYSGYPIYDQPHPPFEHHVSIIDSILCMGPYLGKILGRQS